jgi:transposase-like protein
MAKRGRPVKGAELLDGMEASAVARQRLTLILQTLAGAMTIQEACEVLGVNRSRFHELRRQFLAQATGLLEPRSPGRKSQQPTEAQLEIERLRRQIVQLKLDLKATQVREEIALVMPHLLGKKRGAGAGKKTRRRASPKGTPGGSCASEK